MNLDRELFLAYVEEDNTQRAYFRVHPILTVNGPASEEGNSLWPDQGCLRIVPDRAEQHTFKDRMRQLKNWCFVDLTAFTAEANKIRTNKNYHPDRGEVNRFILYSDAVHPVGPEVFHQVMTGKPDQVAALAAEAVTPLFYVRDDDTIYGPVDRAAPGNPGPAPEMEAEFYQIECPDSISRDFICVRAEYDARPRVTQPARPGRAPAAAPAQEAAPEAAATVPEQAAPVKDAAETQEPAEEKKAEAKEKAASPEDAPIRIGDPLKILDENQTFEETISGLNQPLSGSANLLKSSASHTVIESECMQQHSGKLSGTPLNRTAAPSVTTQPRNRVQEAVYNQCRVVRNDPPAENLPRGAAMRRVQNPVEEATRAVRQAWTVYDARDRLLDDILALDGVQEAMERRLSRKIGVTDLQRAIHEHLSSLEAERLAVLVELNKAKSELETYRHEVMAKASARETEALKQLEEKKAALESSVAAIRSDIDQMNRTRDELAGRIDALQQELPREMARLMADSRLCVPQIEAPVRLVPVCGSDVEMDEILARISKISRVTGVSYDKNRAIATVLVMAVCDRIGVATRTKASVCTMLGNLAAVMGWESSFGVQMTATQPVLTADEVPDATPMLLVSALPSFAPAERIRKIMLSDTMDAQVQSGAYQMDQWPVLTMDVQANVDTYREQDVRSVSAASIGRPLSQGTVSDDTILNVLKPVLELVPPLSGNARKQLTSFVSAASALMDGGIAAACDWAICLWVVPALERTDAVLEKARVLLTEYPMATAAL